jgi:hypothetical protein
MAVQRCSILSFRVPLNKTSPKEASAENQEISCKFPNTSFMTSGSAALDALFLNSILQPKSAFATCGINAIAQQVSRMSRPGKWDHGCVRCTTRQALTSRVVQPLLSNPEFSESFVLILTHILNRGNNPKKVSLNFIIFMFIVIAPIFVGCMILSSELSIAPSDASVLKHVRRPVNESTTPQFAPRNLT